MDAVADPDGDPTACVPAAALVPGAVLPVDAGGGEWVLWRGASGLLGVAPRRCPHLGEDLVRAVVVGDELVCPAHGWCVTIDGRVAKRTERGRLDDKGPVAVPAVAPQADQLVLRW